MKRIPVRVESGTALKLDELSGRLGYSVAALIRALIARGIDKLAEDLTKESQGST